MHALLLRRTTPSSTSIYNSHVCLKPILDDLTHAEWIVDVRPVPPEHVVEACSFIVGISTNHLALRREVGKRSPLERALARPFAVAAVDLLVEE